MLDRMQTRKELYATIGYDDFESLDQSLIKTIVPEGPAKRD
jgi:methylisocitrate lyase